MRAPKTAVQLLWRFGHKAGAKAETEGEKRRPCNECESESECGKSVNENSC